jgi:hypothetical protein
LRAGPYGGVLVDSRHFVDVGYQVGCERVAELEGDAYGGGDDGGLGAPGGFEPATAAAAGDLPPGQLEFEPGDMVEQVGDKLGFVRRRAIDDLKRFRSFIEDHGTETGAWRGEVDPPPQSG